MRPEPGFEVLRYLDQEVVFVHDAARRIVFVSPSVETVLGYSEEAFKAQRTYELIHPDDMPRIVEEAVALRSVPGSSFRSVLRIRHADGRYLWCEIVGRNVLHQDERCVVNTLRDVSERRALEERLQHQAHHDELTGLPNRRYFLRMLEHELSRTGGAGLGVLVLDLDGFKQVNDGLGHAAGDELLQQCAREIARNVRSGDVAARLGGDEFAVLCNRLRDADALRLAAERIRAAASRPYALAGGQGSVALSIGVALARAGDSTSALMRAADEALYVAKRGGGDSVECASR